jgi:hypothetical protein
MKRFSLAIPFLLGAFCLLASPAMAGTATVKWGASTDEDLAGYRVHYGTSSRNYQPAIPVGNVTSFSMNDLEEGTTYYFAVTSMDTSDNESGYSVEVSKTIPVTPQAVVDNLAPSIQITSPTKGAKYSTKTSTVNLSGSASDNTAVDKVTWQSSSGGSGLAAGNKSWSVSDIPLSQGDNIITVTAIDAAGNQGTASLTVSYRPGK